MEDFKKPCLPNTAVKGGQGEDTVKKSKENSDKYETIDQGKSENPYKIPMWSGIPNVDSKYSFEVLKSGQIIDEIKELEKKAFWCFGRLPENDVEMAHPTISRYHAILQYRPKCNKVKNFNDDEKNSEIEAENFPEGWYIYDLGSTHGTFLNKQRIPSKTYIRIRVGHLLRLGASTRSYILQGPAEDEEPESELSVTELKAKRQQEIEKGSSVKKSLVEESSNEDCNWGMAEDADEESDLAHNPYASTNNEELFLDDPKKTLRGYFEREGLELTYNCEEMSAGSFVCRVELPIDDANGRPVIAEVVHKGKKKDCVLQCALEACRILDRHGVLRQANQEPLKKRQKMQQSDSDDDEFWDRTGDIAKKKQRRAEASTSVTLTYEDLIKKESDLDEQIKQIEGIINEYQEQQQRIKMQNAKQGEDLDEFMQTLQEKEIKFDKTGIRKLRIEEQCLKTEKQRVQRLIKLTKPVNVLNMQAIEKNSLPAQGDNATKKQLPMIGKRNRFSKLKILKIESPKKIKESNYLDSDEEEIKDKISKPIEQRKIILTNENIMNNSLIKSTTENLEKNLENKQDETTKSTKDDNGSFNKNENLLSQSDSKIDKEIGSSSRKRRTRIRNRGKRDEVTSNGDADDESSEKYAKWLPPENQTGDGLTELNKKFGY